MNRRSYFSISTFGTSAIIAAAVLCCGTARSLAFDPPADAPAQPDAQAKGDRRNQPALTDPETRKRLRDMLAKRLDSRRRELDSLDKALKMFDEGKSFEEIRSLLPDMPHPGQRGEGRDQWIRRWEEGGGGGPGSPGDGPPGQGAGSNRSGSTEPARPLTDDERKTVREILKATAPKLLDKLVELEKSKPEEAAKQYTEAFRRSRSLLETRKRDPQMFDLRLKEIGFGREAIEASSAIAKLDAPPEPGATPLTADQKAAELKDRTALLRTALRQQYDVRTEIMRKEAATRPAQASEAIEKSVKDMIERSKRGRPGRGGDGERHQSPSSERRQPDDAQPGPKPQQ